MSQKTDDDSWVQVKDEATDDAYMEECITEISNEIYNNDTLIIQRSSNVIEEDKQQKVPTNDNEEGSVQETNVSKETDITTSIINAFQDVKEHQTELFNQLWLINLKNITEQYDKDIADLLNRISELEHENNETAHIIVNTVDKIEAEIEVKRSAVFTSNSFSCYDVDRFIRPFSMLKDRFLVRKQKEKRTTHKKRKLPPIPEQNDQNKVVKVVVSAPVQPSAIPRTHKSVPHQKQPSMIRPLSSQHSPVVQPQVIVHAPIQLPSPILRTVHFVVQQGDKALFESLIQELISKGMKVKHANITDDQQFIPQKEDIVYLCVRVETRYEPENIKKKYQDMKAAHEGQLYLLTYSAKLLDKKDIRAMFPDTVILALHQKFSGMGLTESFNHELNETEKSLIIASCRVV